MAGRVPIAPMRVARINRRLGWALTRAVEWVEDEVSRLHYEGAAGGDARVSRHALAAGALGAAAIVADVAAGPAVGPAIALACELATVGLATHAVHQVARRHGAGRERVAPLVRDAIAHAERERLCPSHVATVWRIVCRVDRDPLRVRAAARSLLLHRAGDLATGVAAKLALRRAPWVPWVGAALRLARLPQAAFAGARLVATVEAHAERSCALDEARLGLLRVISGATPASAASTVEPLFTAAASPGVMRPNAPSRMATAFGAMTSPSPRLTFAIA